MRSTPTAGLEVILGVLPLPLHCKEVALKAANRVHSQQNWHSRGNNSSHRDVNLASLAQILPPDHIPYQKVFGVNRLPPPAQIPNPDFNVYTDGSKDEGGRDMATASLRATTSWRKRVKS